MFVVWSGPLHVPGGSHVGEFPVRWLWNPWGRRGNTSTLDELPVWCALKHWDTRGRHSMLVSSQFVPAWIPCRPAVGWRTWRTHDPFPIIPCHPVYTCFLSWPAAKHLSHPHLSHRGPRAQRKPSCRRTELLAIKMNFCRRGSNFWRRRQLRK